MKKDSTALDFFSPNHKKNWLERFLAFDAGAFEHLLESKGEKFWQTAGEKKALALFHQAARRVPAYRAFLAKHKINPSLITTIGDFKKVPVTDKKNYTSKYSLADRSWDGRVDNSLLAVSSGTTGQPTYWPRSGEQEFEAAVIHELLYRSAGEIDQHKTLLVICFPMGIYVSGLATYLPSQLIAAKHGNLSIITPGNNKPEILRAIKNLGGHYEQIILFGHPFLVKDVIELGKAEGIRWNKTKLRFFFCSEGFNEEWRNYLLKEAGLVRREGAAISTYGSSEMLLIAHETPLSLKLRAGLTNDPVRRKEINRGIEIPNVFQYNPFLRYIEEQNGNLIFTAGGGVPFIRYDLHDGGHLLSFNDGQKLIGQNSRAEATETQTKPWQLPFVLLNGRSDQSIVFYAANIYPEHIRLALDTKAFFDLLSSRFVMRKNYKKDFDEYFEICVELKNGVKATPALRTRIAQAVYHRLREVNTEYNDVCNHFPNKNLAPKIRLCRYQDPTYFPLGLKHRWIGQDTTSK